MKVVYFGMNQAVDITYRDSDVTWIIDDSIVTVSSILSDNWIEDNEYESDKDFDVEIRNGEFYLVPYKDPNQLSIPFEDDPFSETGKNYI